MPQPDISMDSPSRTFRKRDLPPSFASTYRHGHISGHPRSAASQRAFDARKQTILRTLDAEEIESEYQTTVKKILLILEGDRKKNEEIDREVEKITKQREMERKIYWKWKENSDKKGGRGNEPDIKEEGEA